jgi:signal transduction histidine kinase
MPVIEEDFFAGKSSMIYGGDQVPAGCSFLIRPLSTDNVQLGFVRYVYRSGVPSSRLILVTEAILLLLLLLILGILFYIKRNIIKPFHEINDLPYELSKGHVTNGLKETKNRFFGKFIWGLDLLRESLEEHKRKELKLEKDKKLMLLSISHDIKTPLSTIKLYAKALYSDLYNSEEKRHSAAKVIEDKADQIEHFVTEIIRTSSSELFEFDVKQEDFYLSKLVNAVGQAYQEKLTLLKTEFVIGAYQDKMLSGDPDKLVEVFDNLLQNAIKYGDGRRITLSFEEEDNCQLIKVTNTGTPLPSTDFIHMFESFWRGTNALEKQGNGLGLYICRQLLLKMGGDIFAESGEESMSLVVVIRKS